MKEFPFHWVKVPESWLCLNLRHLTPGKIYQILSFVGHSSVTGHVFSIIDNNGDPILCVEKNNSLFFNEDWIIVDYQKNLENILK